MKCGEFLEQKGGQWITQKECAVCSYTGRSGNSVWEGMSL